MMGFQRGLASMVYKLFDKKSTGSGIANNDIKQKLKNYTNQLLENLEKEKFILGLEIIFEVLI